MICNKCGFEDCTGYDCMTRCADCGDEVPRKELHLDFNVCANCWFECRECGDEYGISDLSNLEYICIHCLVTCYGCGDGFLAADMSHTTNLCNACMDQTFLCRECGDRYFEDSECRCRYCDDGDYCEYCIDDHEDRCEDDDDYDTRMHEYDFMPYNLNFRGSGRRFMGVELEVQYGDRRTLIDRLQDIDPHEEWIYCKQDGSLSDDSGVEITSHPATLSIHQKKFPWKKICDALQMNGFKDSQPGCGLHVHVSRQAFGHTENQIRLNQAKMLIIFWRFWSEIVKFSRRDAWGIRDYAQLSYDPADGRIRRHMLEDSRDSTGHYDCVNFRTGKNTVEFRIFNSTTEHHTLIASLQFVDCLVDIVLNSGFPWLSKCTWSDLCNMYFNNRRTLKAYLEELELCA